MITKFNLIPSLWPTVNDEQKRLISNEVLYMIWKYVKLGDSIHVAKRKASLTTSVSPKIVDEIYRNNEKIKSYISANKPVKRGF